VTVWTDELLDRLAHTGDAEADAVIEKHASEGTAFAPRDLVRDVARSLELPPEKRSPAIADYLRARPDLPPWADRDLLKQSADFFDLRGLEIGSALFLASLPEAYAGARGARVLRLTSRLVTDTVRRINETAQMVFDAMDQDGLEPATGRGYHDIRRVRLMHAAIRFLIEHDPEVVKTESPQPGKTWCPALGRPLNQEDLLGALMTFTVVPLDCLDKLGIGYEQDDAEAYLHAWSVVGYLMGVEQSVLPISVADARVLTDRIRQRQHRPSEDAVDLGTALIDAMQNSIRWRLARGLPGALMKFYVGDDVAAIVGQAKAPRIAWFFGPVHRLLGAIGLAQRHNRLLDNLTRHVSSAILRQFLDANRPGRDPFSLPLSLQARLMHTEQRWHL
jgi:hypothetical protein